MIEFYIGGWALLILSKFEEDKNITLVMSIIFFILYLLSK